MNKGAEFSVDRIYRYKLWRIWDNSKPLAMVIGLNPSNANENKSDQTINYLIKMLAILGYGGFYMMNCWPFITSKPKLLEHNEISDSWNIDTITVTAGSCKDVIFAWGNFKIIRDKGKDKMFIEMFPNALCFGKTNSGAPLHPLAMMYNGKSNNPELIKYL